MKRVLSIFIGIFFLIAFLFVGIPIEIITQPLRQIGVLLLISLIGFLFYLLFRENFRIKSLGVKILALCLTGLLFFVYILVGFDEISPMLSFDYPMYQDIAKYTNKDGDVIIERFTLSSDSTRLHNYSEVIYDFENGIRISNQYDYDSLIGDWICHDLETDSIYSVTITIENRMKHRTIKPYISLE